MSVTTGSYTDAVGNSGAAGSDGVAIDRANDALAVDIVEGALSDGSSSSIVTFVFSEAPVGFGPTTSWRWAVRSADWR